MSNSGFHPSPGTLVLIALIECMHPQDLCRHMWDKHMGGSRQGDRKWGRCSAEGAEQWQG